MCAKYIRDEIKKHGESCKKTIWAHSAGIKQEWNTMLINYCDTKIDENYKIIDKEQFSVRGIKKWKRKFKKAIREYAADSCNFRQTYISQSFQNSIEFSLVIKDYQKKYYSDEILDADFINDPILKTGFNLNITECIEEICDKYRGETRKCAEERISENYCSYQNFGMENKMLLTIWRVFIILASISNLFTVLLIAIESYTLMRSLEIFISVYAGFAVIPLICNIVTGVQKNKYVKCITDSILEIQGGGKINEKY